MVGYEPEAAVETNGPLAAERVGRVLSFIPVGALLLFVAGEVFHATGLRLLFGGFACVWAVVHAVRHKRLPAFRFRPLDAWLCLIVSLGVVLRYTSIYPPNTVHYSQQVSILLVAYCFVRLFVQSETRQRAVFIGMTGLGLLVVVPSVIITVVSYWRLTRLDAGALINFRDQFACLRDEMPSAWITVLLALGSFPLVLSLDAKASRGVRRLGYVGFVLSFIAVGLTFSRGLYMGALTFAVLSGWAIHRAGILSWRDLARRVALTAGIVLLALAPFWSSVLGTLAIVKTESQVRSIEGRVEVWKQSARMIAAHPLFGAGPGNFAMEYAGFKAARSASVFTAFNLGLEVAVEQGLFGVLALLGALAALLSQSRLIARPAAWPRAGVVVGPVLGACVAGLLVRDLSYSSLLTSHAAVLLWLMGALISSSPVKQ